MLNRLKDVFKSFQKHNVKYVIIGGIASILHGVPRATFDLDILIDATGKNAQGLLNALSDSGFGTVFLTNIEDLLSHEITIFKDKVRIDVQTSTPGINFDMAWKQKVKMEYIGIELKRENSLNAFNMCTSKYIDNVIVVNGEALEVMKIIFLDGIISQVHVYFPTPYPSALGLKERLVTSSFVIELHRLLHTGGLFRFVTDHKSYYFDVLELISSVEWQPMDWSDLNIEREAGYLVGTHCEKEFRSEGRDIYEAQVIKWG